jgi:hypothetical protein
VAAGVGPGERPVGQARRSRWRPGTWAPTRPQLPRARRRHPARGR